MTVREAIRYREYTATAAGITVSADVAVTNPRAEDIDAAVAELKTWTDTEFRQHVDQFGVQVSTQYAYRAKGGFSPLDTLRARLLLSEQAPYLGPPRQSVRALAARWLLEEQLTRAGVFDPRLRAVAMQDFPGAEVLGSPDVLALVPNPEINWRWHIHDHDYMVELYPILVAVGHAIRRVPGHTPNGWSAVMTDGTIVVDVWPGDGFLPSGGPFPGNGLLLNLDEALKRQTGKGYFAKNRADLWSFVAQQYLALIKGVIDLFTLGLL
jgi:hypothetical protein